MPGNGSCLCGKSTFSFGGEPQMKALCHCGDCKKISGADRSVNIVVGPDGFTSSGTKTYTKKADSGKSITSYFCGDCGSTLYREAEAFGDAKIIKAGTLDGGSSVIEAVKPDAELFAPSRPSWVSQVPGTAEKSTMS